MLKKLLKILIPVLIVLLPFGLKYLFSDTNLISIEEESSALTIKWRDLRDLDYSSDVVPESLVRILEQPVRIAGYAVTLEDDVREVSEFLLVSSPMSCIHVPAPPPNQLIHVRLDKEMSAFDLMRPVWVEGILKIVPLDGAYAKQGFEMQVNRVSEFRSSF